MTSEAYAEQQRLLRESEEKKRRVQAGLPAVPPPPEPKRSTDELIRDMAQQFKGLMEEDRVIVDKVEAVASTGNQNPQFLEVITLLTEIKNEFTTFASAFLQRQQQHRERVGKTLALLDDSLR